MNLKEQLAQVIAKSKAILEQDKITDEDMEKVRAYREEAKRLADAIEIQKSLDGFLPQPDPVRPALPGAGDGNAVDPPAQGQKRQDPAVSAAYIMKFGEGSAAVKAVLSDLHGSMERAADLYWQQRKAFNYYLRSDPQRPVPEWVQKALSQIVMTPQAVKEALDAGLSSVESLKTVMVEAADTLGGYIVPIDFQSRVIERLKGMTIMRERASSITTSRDRVALPKVTGGNSQYTSAVRATWVDETPTAGTAATNLTWGLEEIPVHTQMAEAFLTRDLVEDSAFNIESYLVEKFAEAAAIDEDNQFLVGDGNGKPEGILPGSSNKLGLTSNQSTAASGTFAFSDLVTTAWAINAQYRSNAVWMAEKATYAYIAAMKDGMGQYYWREVWGNQVREGGKPVPLLGYPTLEQEALPSIGSSAYPIIFGDPRGYTIVDRVGMSVERYLDSATARINQICYVMRRRLGGQVTEPWRFVLLQCSA